MLYRGTAMVEALSEVKGKGTYLVTRDGGTAHEERIEPRLLPGGGLTGCRCSGRPLARQVRPAPASSPGAPPAAPVTVPMKSVTTRQNSSGEVAGELWPWCGAIQSLAIGQPARELAGGRHGAPVARAADDQ